MFKLVEVEFRKRENAKEVFKKGSYLTFDFC